MPGLVAVCAALLLAALHASVGSAAARGAGHAPGAAKVVDPTFLPNWQGRLSSVLGGLPLSRLPLPITHDTETYDLSATPSEGAIDGQPLLSWILHEFASLTPGKWIRSEAHTQGLNVTAQLDNGMRYVDFRIMEDNSSKTVDQWYSLHFVQSNHLALDYLRQIRTWVDAHPQEVIVMWVSKHGGICKHGQDAYPYVTVAQKQAFWAQMKAVFDGVLFDPTVSSLNETSINDLVKLNHRVVMAMGDWAEFTGNDTKNSVDACATVYPLRSAESEAKNAVRGVQAVQAAGMTDGSSYYAGKAAEWKQDIDAGAASIENATALNRLNSAWFDGDPPTAEQMLYAFEVKYLGGLFKNATAECVALYGIDGMTWCPPGLLDNSQLQNYYLQLSIEAAYKANVTLPTMAVNVLDLDGTIRVGTSAMLPVNYTIAPDGTLHYLPTSSSRSLAWAMAPTDDYTDTKYPFVDTLLASNVRSACAPNGVAAGNPDCDTFIALLEARRARYPLTTWTDAVHGRYPTVPA